MELQKLYQLIGLQPEVIERMRTISEDMDLENAEPYLKQMMNHRTAKEAYGGLETLLEEDPDHMKMLYCQLECARRVYDKYRQKDISESTYVDTMKCFTRFLGECGKKNGRIFFDRGWWTYRQISMSLFRIGTLEFEFEEHEGEMVIAVHIPSDADLSIESVDESFGMAGRFFRAYYPDYKYGKYTCDSWLLSPALKQLLPEKAKIVSFQNRFLITQVDEQNKEFIEWLFQVPADTAYKELPVRTSLQRKVRDLLMDGGTVGAAYGILRI